MDEAASASRVGWRDWSAVALIVLLYGGSLFSFRLGEARTFTGHESLVAQISREMLAGGDWLVPRIGGKPWLEKPPLPHWCVAVAGAIHGTVDEGTARLPSVLAALIGILIMTLLVLRWFGAQRGLLTGLILATSYYVATYARLAEADVYLWTLIIGCMAAFSADWVRSEGDSLPQRVWPRWIFFALLGLTQLTKGPLFGAVLILLPCLVFLANVALDGIRGRGEPRVGFGMLARTLRPFRWFLHPGILMGLALAAVWPILIVWRFPQAGDLWWMHTFGRVTGPKVLNPGPWWYYFSTLPWQLLPWTPCVLLGMSASLARAGQHPRGADRFLWIWFGTQFVFLSAVAAKHHHYLIHALPPCAVWASEGLLRVFEGASTWWNRFRTGVAVRLMMAALFGLGLAFTTALPSLFPHWACVTDVVLLTLLGLATLLGVVVTLARGAGATAAAVLFSGLWLAYGWMHFSISGKSDGYVRETEFLRSLDRWVDREQPLYVLGLEPSRLLLYAPCPLEVCVHPQEIAERWKEPADERDAHSDQQRPCFVLTSRGHEPQLRKFGEVVCVVCMDPSPSGKFDPFRELGLYRVTWKPGAFKSKASVQAAWRPGAENGSASP
jgi:4-amino-4-deoxy-L-arabinose transferase-like glycosyltransferase